jgi:hypothetical protein
MATQTAWCMARSVFDLSNTGILIRFRMNVYLLFYIVTCFTRQRDNNNVDSSDLTREFIATIAEITHNR